MSSAQSTPQAEVHEYQAEMQKLLDILVHSLYTEREIFLRELLSNSADALSKVQFLALTSADQLLNPDDPCKSNYPSMKKSKQSRLRILVVG